MSPLFVNCSNLTFKCWLSTPTKFGQFYLLKGYSSPNYTIKMSPNKSSLYCILWKDALFLKVKIKKSEEISVATLPQNSGGKNGGRNCSFQDHFFHLHLTKLFLLTAILSGAVLGILFFFVTIFFTSYRYVTPAQTSF